MRFGFDIDDTLINLRGHAISVYNQKLNQNVGEDTFRQMKTLKIHEAFGLTTEEGNAMWVNSMEEIYFSDCPAYEGALELLQELHEEGHEIFYITSRPKKYCQQTRTWMKKHGFPVVDEHFYCGMQDFEKINIITSLQLDYYFDDKPAVLETMNNISTKIFVKDQPYNQKVNLPRLKEWSEFTELVTK